MRWLKSWVSGGADEIGWDDLVRRVVKAISDTAAYGARGRVAFPPEVEVTVTAGGAGLELLREFVQRPEFDREVAASVANRCDCAPADLPLRSYLVEEGPRKDVRARELQAEARWELVVEGGDLDGKALAIPPGAAELRFGRGEWHGSDRQLRNDLVVAESCGFVSRRAGRLLLSGHLLEVESFDQGDYLTVRRAAGDTVRPSRSASGRAPARAGDVIELGDGAGQSVRLRIERRRL